MKQKISIIIPFYNEEGNIINLVEEIRKAVKKDFKNLDYEIIMVDDGSRDNTWQEIKECKEKDPNVIWLKLNKNYWQSVAMDAGFRQAEGEIVVSLDWDWQNDPADIKKLYDKLIADNLDLVAWRRQKRKDPWSIVFITKTAKLLRRMLIKDGVNDSWCTLRVYKKEVVENLYLWWEMHRYIVAISKINWFKIGELPVNHRARWHGVSKYNWTKSMKWLIDLIYIWFIGKYESRPLHLFWFLGILNLFLGFLMFLYAVFQKLFFSYDFSNNWYTLLGIFMIQIWLMLFVFGIMLDLMIRSYYNTSSNKRYLVKEKY